MVDHVAAEGGDRGGDLQAGHLADDRARKTVHAVRAHLSACSMCDSVPKATLGRLWCRCAKRIWGLEFNGSLHSEEDEWAPLAIPASSVPMHINLTPIQATPQLARPQLDFMKVSLVAS